MLLKNTTKGIDHKQNDLNIAYYKQNNINK